MAVLCVDIGDNFGENRPLDEGQIRKLSVNGIHLVDRIDSNPAFVTELANVGCITWPQRQYIVDLVSSRDKNEKLLEFLTRRSAADLQNFIKIISKYQAHLVQFLVTNGGEIYICEFMLAFVCDIFF